jgi:hypothetical protein
MHIDCRQASKSKWFVNASSQHEGFQEVASLASRRYSPALQLKKMMLCPWFISLNPYLAILVLKISPNRLKKNDSMATILQRLLPHHQPRSRVPIGRVLVLPKLMERRRLFGALVAHA